MSAAIALHFALCDFQSDTVNSHDVVENSLLAVCFDISDGKAINGLVQK